MSPTGNPRGLEGGNLMREIGVGISLMLTQPA
jgi:hypothetical protein